MPKSIIKKVLIVALLALIVIQIFSIDKTNPPIDPKLDFYANQNMPADVKKMLVDACNDCHSHDREYPWYTNIEPISWWIRGHIRGGTQKLNFSEWNKYDDGKKNHKLEECIEVLEEMRMPPKSYKWMHPEAKLSDSDRNKLIDYLKSIR